MITIRVHVDGYLRRATTYLPDTEDKKNAYQVYNMDLGKITSEGWDTELNSVHVDYTGIGGK